MRFPFVCLILFVLFVALGAAFFCALRAAIV